MVIFFNIIEARTQLIEKGLVYTLRPKMRKVGNDTAVFGTHYNHENIGKVFIEFVKEISVPIDLLPYVHLSGFKTVADWQDRTKDSKYLYKVMMVDQ